MKNKIECVSMMVYAKRLTVFVHRENSLHSYAAYKKRRVLRALNMAWAMIRGSL